MASGSNRPPAGKSYNVSNIGEGARVQVGENLSWYETSLASTPSGATLEQQFQALAKELATHPDLDEDRRALAVKKTNAVAEGLAHAKESPGGLKEALIDAKDFFGRSATWAWAEMSRILQSEAAQKTIGTITDAATRAAIGSITGRG